MPTRTTTEPWLTPGVRGIGLASLLNDLGHEVPTALLPSLLTSTLGAPAAALGVIEGVSDGLAGVARLGGGALADDPQRRRATAVAGYTCTAVLSGLIGAATSAWQVGVLRAGAWAARGLRVPSRNALLADAVPASVYGRAYGFERAMDNLGAIGGPLLALALVGAVGIRTAILLSIIPGLLAVGAIIYAIRHLERPERRERVPIRLRVRPVLAGGLGRLMAGIGVFELGNIAATILILRATDLFEPGAFHDGCGPTRDRALHLLQRRGDPRQRAGGEDRRLARDGPRADRWRRGVRARLRRVRSERRELRSAGSLLRPGRHRDRLRGNGRARGRRTPRARGSGDSAFGVLAGIQSFGNLAASAVAGVLYTVASPSVAFIYASGCMLVALVLLVRTDGGT